MSAGGTRRVGWRAAALAVGALGVVFGDIGTSPLYAMSTIFSPDAIAPVALDAASVYGVISLIVWSFVVIVTVMYVRLFMRADNNGEGGVLALTALLLQIKLPAKALSVLAAVGIFGAALFFGDSVITPAVSVLSAIEGLEVIDPDLERFVVPGAAVLLFGLFALQKRGTERVGRFFGPIMVLWFIAIAAIGSAEIMRHPEVLQALSPHWAVRFLLDEPLVAFLSLGGVVLTITGAEALYADMGHFGRKPIKRGWLGLVFPALTINYLGQAALLVNDPAAISSPFFEMVPAWAEIPMVALATLATVVASQAVITGAFSVARQAARLGYLPALKVVHTSHDEEGQIYMPGVNWLLAAGVLALVLVFQSSERLTAAYGLAVIGTVVVTTLLFLGLAWARRRRPRWQVVLAAAVFLPIVLTFLAANLVKIPQGGYLPVGIGIVLFTVMATWSTGGRLVRAGRRRGEGALPDFPAELRDREDPVHRVPGSAVFLGSGGADLAPLALRASVEHTHTLHRHSVIVTVETERTPRVPPDQRVSIDGLGFDDDGITHVTARYGYMDNVSLPSVLAQANRQGLEGGNADTDDVSYFISSPKLRVTSAPGMARWRKHLFVATARAASDPVDFLDLPRRQTVLMGTEVEL